MIFITNKYTGCYFRIIENAKSRKLSCYTESHHIIPKSLNGSNAPSNLVKLTAREHWLVHKLLTKMTEGKDRQKMLYAFGMFRVDKTGDRVLTSKQYEESKKAFVEAHSNRIVSESTRQKLKESNRAVPKDHYCKHCSEWFKKAHYSRWHGDNCKKNPNIDPLVLEERSLAQKSRMTDEARKKLSNARKGENNSFYGKKHSQSTLTKLRGKIPHNKGIPMGEEQKRLLSQVKKGRKWYYDPISKKSKQCSEQPPGWLPGRK